MFLGSYHGGSDVISEEKVASITNVIWDIKDLNLLHGKRYYASVTAVNMAGLASTAHGDGFVVSLCHYMGALYPTSTACTDSFVMSLYYHYMDALCLISTAHGDVFVVSVNGKWVHYGCFM